MLQDQFELACDRLSQGVDGGQFERLRWARTEGPMLARLVELAHASLEGRSDLELTDEGSTNDVKRFVLKVHGFRVVSISLWLRSGQAVLMAEAIERSKYALAPGNPVATDFARVDEAWMAAALQELFSRIQV